MGPSAGRRSRQQSRVGDNQLDGAPAWKVVVGHGKGPGLNVNEGDRSEQLGIGNLSGKPIEFKITEISIGASARATYFY